MSKFTELVQGNISDINQVSLYGVTSIGNRAFNSCTGLTSIIIPNSVTSIGNHAFYGCSNLTEIIIPKNVTNIWNSAFRSCSNLTSITIPSGVTSIGNSAFNGCSSLTSIIIPDTVTSIDRLAFAGTTTSVSKRLRINFLGQNPATIYNFALFSGGTFTQSTTSSTMIYADVHIPVGSEATYRANSAWNTFFNSPNVTITADL